MLKWENKQDGIDDVLADDINSIANELINAQIEQSTIKTDLSSLKLNLDNFSDNKADKATTLSGYGIEDAYTKDETDVLLNNKLDFIEGVEEDIDIYTGTNENGTYKPQLYIITSTDEVFGIENSYILYAGRINDAISVGVASLFQYKISSDGVFKRTGSLLSGTYSWSEWDEYATKDFVRETALGEAQAAKSEISAQLQFEYYKRTEIDELILGSWEALV